MTLIDLKQALEADDRVAVNLWLLQHPGSLREVASNPDCGALRLLAAVRSEGMADLLLAQGLTVAQVGDWWAQGFGLAGLSPTVAEHFIRCGATITPHAAAGLGLVERLRTMLDQHPELMHAKGGDGGRPLHFSRDVATARLLVERGANLDDRDDDHDSTAAQWRIGEAPEVTRYLIEQGAQSDIFMAARLGDLELAHQLVSENRCCTTYRIGNNSGPFPGIGARGGGGSIYQWTLGFNRSAQEIAHLRGHHEVFVFLMSQTPPHQQLLIACMLADRELANSIAASSPGLVNGLGDEDRELLAKCCWETNLNREAVRLMLDLGFPIGVPESNHGFQALHNAAWCGDAELVELLLQRGHPVDRRDPRYQSTALGYAIHSCVTARRHPEGDFPSVVRLLLEAGTPLDASHFPSGDEGIDAVIKSHGIRQV